MEELVLLLKEKVLEHIDISDEISNERLYEAIDFVMRQSTDFEYISIIDRIECRNRIFNSIKKLDILEELLQDNAITEIMINGYKDIFVEKNGSVSHWNKSFVSNEKLDDIVQQIAAKSNRIVNEATPILDTRLSDGSRVNIVLPPIAIDGPAITIRKFYEKPLTMDKLIEFGSITKDAAEFLEKLVKARYNIFISGSTSSGKTTFLNVLSNYIDEDERVITIEDSAELQIHNVRNLIRLEARNSNTEGKNEIKIRALIKSALRMRPDRVIIGEVRGEECIDLLQAMNTGHDGSLSTGHSNSSKDMLSRLETMVLMGMDMPLEAIRGQIASSIDIIVHLARFKDKKRRIMEIVEIDEYKNGEIILNPLYIFDETNGLTRIGQLLHNEKLMMAGMV